MMSVKLMVARKASMPQKAAVTPLMKAAFGPSWSGTETYQPLERLATMSAATDGTRVVALLPDPLCKA